MKFKLEVNNTTKQKVSKKIFLAAFKQTLESLNWKFLDGKTIELSVALVSEQEIQTLNGDYRKKHKPTDVLSFSEWETTQQFQDFAEKNSEQIFIGELILCLEYIDRNAKDDGETFEYALTYITSHGILHLLGLGHGKKMFTMQRAVADTLVN